ncbi:thioesterase II family protein [Saccharothrix saharensis]|uniref:thioesterase II family protein n=1 Tax=Saccharothrix saharensis TaxID=571190 RepID=UPI0036BA24C6
MATTTTADRWLRTRTPRPSAELTLVCLPHAGGSASYYRDWGARLPASVETRVVQYPGREERLVDAPVDDMAAMADVLTDVLAPLFDRPVVLFGHSMGAAIAYEVTRRCEERGRPPALLVASGFAAPHRRAPRDLHTRDDDALVAEITRVSGDDAAALADPDLRELLLPTIRADYRLIERYTPTAPDLMGTDAMGTDSMSTDLLAAAPVRTPLVVYRGDADPDVDHERGEAWRELTASGELREHRAFPGGHFYFRHDPTALLGAISAHLGRVRPVTTH